MNSPTGHWILPFSKKLRRFWLHLFIIVTTVAALLPRAQPANAQITVDTSVAQAVVEPGIAPVTLAQTGIVPSPIDTSICRLTASGPSCPDYPPPDLLYLNQGGLYAATAEQVASLKILENEAIENLIEGHGLSPDDADALKSWARSEAQADLYGLLLQAIYADSPTTDQQNAVDWMTAVVQRQNLKAAEAAGREDVKWAGLDKSTYEQLLRGNASQSDLKAFLSGTPVNYNHTDIGLADGGWCVYRSPEPYSSEYTGYTDVLCTNPCPFICFPPTPSYDQFVKWGESVTTYPLLSSGYFLSASVQIALGLSLGLTMAAAAVATIPIYVLTAAYASGYAAAMLGVTAPTAALAAAAAAEAAVDVAAVASFTVGGALALVTFILVALTTAIIAGIIVTDAAKLPEKLAELIAKARTDVPDLATLAEDDEGAVTLFSVFVAVTVPSPVNMTCDNALFSLFTLPPGLYPLVTPSGMKLIPSSPCLNPTTIPPASATDPQFIVTAESSTAQTIASSITWQDTDSGTTTTARLSGNWFITQNNGATAQTLRIAYTDWDDKKQNAWLLGNPAEGYTFLSFSAPADSSTTVSADTCVADGYCSYDSSIYYVGADGQNYSASVRGYLPPTGTPTYSEAVVASPVSFEANDFAPAGATLPITYQWRFQKAGCGIPCQSSDFNNLGPSYTDPVAGPTASYTWETGGSYYAQLTATDANGVQAVSTFQVAVAGVPPTLSIYPDCATSSAPCNQRTGETGTAIALGGTAGYTGDLDNVIVTVSWGDGPSDVAGAGPNSLSLVGNPLTLTPVPGTNAFTLASTHTYANPGVYNGTVWVADWNGNTASQTFVMTIKGQQSIDFPSIRGKSYGDVFTISATGGASGQPVTFSASSSCALSNVSEGPGTGSATVTVISAGYCDIMASQAGTGIYNPAPSVTQRVFTLLARLTVTASSATITYGESAPSVTPDYSGFRNSDTASVLISPATCVVAPHGGAAGTYATSCSGAAAANYSLHYVPGTLTINPAPLTVTANDNSMTYGGAVPSFDAAYSGLVNGDAESVVSGLTCGAKDSGLPVSSSTPAGSYPITCSGGSAANYSISYVAGTLTIEKASTSTALSSSPNPSVFGQLVTLTAAIAVSAPGSGQPGGTVAFQDGGSDIADCAARPVDTASGTATCTTIALGVAQHDITATYNGDANFVGSSTAAALTQTVNKAAVTTTLGGSVNPSIAGQTVAFTATVAAAEPGAGVPTGSVTFRDGATALGAGTLSTSDGATVATFRTSSLGVGVHTITATYSGDGNFLAGDGATLTQYVNNDLSAYPRLPSGAYNLSNTNLVGGYFVNLSLAGASLSRSNLTGAVFLGANLAGANLASANLKGANLERANLEGADLSISNLTEANLAGANLTGVNLTGVNLKGATGLTTATLTNVIWNRTTCPDGTNSRDNGGTCVGHL